MGKRVVLGLLLLVGLLVGLTLEPDSGTAVSLGPSDVTGATVGANHAKPLPRLFSVDDIVRTVAYSLVTVLVLVVLARPGLVLRAPRAMGGRRSLEWARIPAAPGTTLVISRLTSRRLSG